MTAVGPKRRTQDLITRTTIDGTVIAYDLGTEVAVELDPTTARVFDALDGRRDVDALAAELGLDAATVSTAIARLSLANLLDEPTSQLARRTVLMGAGAAAVVPLLAVVAPTAAAADSSASSASTLSPTVTVSEDNPPNVIVTAAGFPSDAELTCTPSSTTQVTPSSGPSDTGVETVPPDGSGGGTFSYYDNGHDGKVTFTVAGGTYTVKSAPFQLASE